MVRKSITWILIVLLIVIGAFSGCSKEKQIPKTNESTKDDEQGVEDLETSSDKLKLPIVEPQGSVSLTIACADNWYSPKSYASGLPVYQEIEDRTGVKIIWEVSPQDQYTTVMQTRVAAVDLPDIFHLTQDALKMGEQGLIIPLNELINKYAPDIKKLFYISKIVKNGITSPDGNIYYLPQIGEGVLDSEFDMEKGAVDGPVGQVNNWVPAIRKDWLEKLGLQIPVTIDDWFSVLKSFKENDPNENGKDDELPIAATWPGTHWCFSSAYGLTMGSLNGDWFLGNDGKVKYSWVQPQLKDYIIFLNKLYKNELIDPEFPSATYDTTLPKTQRNLIGAVFTDWVSNYPSFNNALKSGGVEDANFIPVLPPVLNQGDEPIVYKRYPVLGGAGIGVNCKNSEVAIKWLDYHFAHPEGIRFQMYGTEEKTYVMKEGKPVFTDFVLNNPDGFGPFEAIRSIGGWGQLPYIQTKQAYLDLYAQLPDVIKFSNDSWKYQKDSFPVLQRTTEEINELSGLYTEINTYRDETLVKMILGTISVDEFDTYLSKMMSIGVDRITQIVQQQYDRTIK